MAAITIFASCESPAKKVEDAKDNLAVAQDNLEKAKEDSIAAHKQARAEYESMIEENERQLMNYKLKIAKEKTADAKKDEERLEKLEKMNADMKASVNGYEVATLESWNIFKTEFFKQRDDFNNEINELGKSLAK